MNKHDINTLLTVATNCTHKRFDVVPVLQFLYRSDTISPALYQELERLYGRGEACLKIIIRLARECSCQQLIYALFMCNHSDLAEQLLQDRYHRGNTGVYSLARTGGSDSCVAIFYKTQKTNVDNGVFKDKNEYLWKLAQSLKGKIRRLPSNSSRQRREADKLMITHCLRLETYQDTSERFSIIQDMSDGMLLSSVTAEGNALFVSKLGSTYALEGNFERSSEHIREAHSVLFVTKPSFVVHYIYLNEVFTKLLEYKNTPTDEIKTRLLFLGNRGLLSTKEDRDESHTRQIKLMLLTFMISCLLGVGVNFDEIEVEVTNSDWSYAKGLLAQFDELSDSLESRREMAYCYLMSRLLRYEDRAKALVYAKRAECFTEDGAFRGREIRNISNFITKLESPS